MGCRGGPGRDRIARAHAKCTTSVRWCPINRRARRRKARLISCVAKPSTKIDAVYAGNFGADMLAIPHAMYGRRPVFPPTPATSAAVTGRRLTLRCDLHNGAWQPDRLLGQPQPDQNGAPTYLTSRNGAGMGRCSKRCVYFAATIAGWNTAASPRVRRRHRLFVMPAPRR